MSEFNFSALESFQKTISNGFAEAAAAFSRTFDGAIITIALGSSGAFDLQTVPAEYQSAGLLLLPSFEGKAAAILIPKSTGLIPDWCDKPDATGQSKLTTLAQEWGMSFFPDEFFPDDFQAFVVPQLIAAVQAGKLGENPGYITLKLINSSGKESNALFILPLELPKNALEINSNTTQNKAETQSSTVSQTSPVNAAVSESNDSFLPFNSQELYTDGKNMTVDDLPGFTKSLLKVKMPVAAVLASSKRPIKVILELGVGSVVQFDKLCDSFLDLQVGQINVGTGEAVKVGDKFGLRVHSIQLPNERFRTVEVRKEGEFKRRKRGVSIIGKAPVRTLEEK
ncbi:MAG: FliM/FliN family flagellar motor switch protein [Planctomycetaceae bacterium]|jgi:flagellar motor switch/type III secretory pathway protein FliN|nr:FliM/FliN family flagellar motor switch protein [Planctomycetaceae bacterium]